MNAEPQAVALQDVVELRDVPGYEGLYSVTRDGRVWAYPRKWVTGGNIRLKHDGIWLRPWAGGRGYPVLSLNNGKKRQWLLHRLVAITWIPNPLGLPQINHLNGVKADVRSENLEWCTAAGNSQHAHRTGLVNLDTDTFRASVRRNAFKAHAATRKLTYEQADDARRRFAEGERKSHIAKSLGIAFATLNVLLKGETYVR